MTQNHSQLHLATKLLYLTRFTDLSENFQIALSFYFDLYFYLWNFPRLKVRFPVIFR